MLDKKYGEGRRGRFAIFIVCWLIVHIHDVWKQGQFEVLDRLSENPVPLDDMQSKVYDQPVEVFGETFAAKTARDSGWARRLLSKAQVAG